MGLTCTRNNAFCQQPQKTCSSNVLSSTIFWVFVIDLLKYIDTQQQIQFYGLYQCQSAGFLRQVLRPIWTSVAPTAKCLMVCQCSVETGKKVQDFMKVDIGAPFCIKHESSLMRFHRHVSRELQNPHMSAQICTFCEVNRGSLVAWNSYLSLAIQIGNIAGLVGTVVFFSSILNICYFLYIYV